jgi:surface antigen
VLVWVGREPCRRRLYNDNGTFALRLWRCLRRPRQIPIKPIAAVLSFMAVSGCSYQLASLVSSDDNSSQVVTGTIGASTSTPPGTVSKAFAQAELDLAYARAAATEAFSRGSRDASLPWRNPHSGARGNITPLATSYSEAGMACRDFLASYMHGESQDWLEGAGCRTATGNWEIRRLKPLKSS